MGAIFRRAEFDGYGLRYCVLGSGSPVALIKPHREPRVFDFANWLAARHTIFQIEPLGYGRSDRPVRHSPGGIEEQGHAVLDQEGVNRFVVWGYSAGGAMALVVTQASGRVRDHGAAIRVADGEHRPVDLREDRGDVRGVSSDPRSGFAGAVTGTPLLCNPVMTPFQLDASAKAPWTSTTVAVSG